MVLNKSELIASLQHEVRILLHLASKIDRATLDYRPSPKQRSTIELLKYLSVMGPALVEAAKAGGFDPAVFTAAERAYCLDCKTPITRLAGRFAVKEAVLKALGTGWRGGIQWTDIETVPDPLGKPLTTLTGQTRELAARLGIQRLLVSISHAGEYAIASVIAVG